jgi:hypothetical protein
MNTEKYVLSAKGFFFSVFCLLVIGFCFGWGTREYTRPRGVRVSGTAIGEIHFSPKCMGMEKDWFVNRHYVYANCPGGPITVQNYEFK